MQVLLESKKGFYIGDPIYALKSELQQEFSLIRLQGGIPLKVEEGGFPYGSLVTNEGVKVISLNNKQLAFINTGADGVYVDKYSNHEYSNHEYYCDSACIGIFPLELVNQNTSCLKQLKGKGYELVNDLKAVVYEGDFIEGDEVKEMRIILLPSGRRIKIEWDL